MNTRRMLGLVSLSVVMIALLGGVARAEDGRPDSPEALYFRALHLEQRLGPREIEEAAGMYRHIVSRFPDHPISGPALLRLGMCQRKLRDVEGARRSFQEVLERYPDRPDLRQRAEVELRMLEAPPDGPPPEHGPREEDPLAAMRRGWEAMGLEGPEIEWRLEIEHRAAERERERRERLGQLERELRERNLPPEELERMVRDYDRVLGEVNARLREQEYRKALEERGRRGPEARDEHERRGPQPRDEHGRWRTDWEPVNPWQPRPDGVDPRIRELMEELMHEMRILRGEIREMREELIQLRRAVLGPRKPEPPPDVR